MSNIVIDDTNSVLTYSGQWTLLANGSSRQWDSTVHSTFQYGATVSFGFRGSVCKVYGTVPPGNGSAIVIDVTIDGSVSPTISTTSGSAAVYANLFYQSSALESIWHTVIITNRGSAGNLDFEFDRVELDANDILPIITPISRVFTASSTSSSQTSPSSSSALTQSTSQSSSNSAHLVPVSTVIGIVGGLIALFISVLLLFLCYRRRKAINHRLALMGIGSNNQNKSQNPNIVATPFPLQPLPSSSTDLKATHFSSRLPLSSAMSEKVLRQQTPANMLETDLQTTSLPTDLSPSSNVPAFSVSISKEQLASNSSPQEPPEPNQAAAEDDATYHARNLSGYIAGPSPPAYRPNNE